MARSTSPMRWRFFPAGIRGVFRRRRFQYGLSTLLAVVALMAAALGWLGCERKALLAELRACKQLDAMGGHGGGAQLANGQTCDAYWDWGELRHGRMYQGYTTVFVSGATLRRCDWANLEAFRSLDWLHIQESRLEETIDLSGLSRSLRQLDISDTPLTSRQVLSIGRLSQLEALSLSDTGLTDPQCELLGELVQLEDLSLESDALSSSSLAFLDRFTHLRRLSLRGSRITGDVLPRLHNARKLEYLGLWNAPIDDDDLREVSKLRGLSVLVLCGTQITDEGLPWLKPLTNLRELYLRDTAITDAGARRLPELAPGLTALDVSGTRVTRDAIPALKGMPKLKWAQTLLPDGVPRTPRAPGEEEEPKEGIVVPYLPGLGPAVAFHTVDFSPMVDRIDDERGTQRRFRVPFESPGVMHRVRLAVWADGTVIWDAGEQPGQPRYLQGRVEPSAVEQRVASALGAAKRTPEIDQCSSAAKHGWPAVSLVGCIGEDESLLLYSFFDTMDDLHEKWSWTEPNGSIQDYDSELTQSEYAAAVPAGFRAYLEEWYRRKDHLWAIVPETGAKIDQQKPVQWIALPVPGGAGGRSQENRKASKRAESTAPLRGSAVQ